MQEQSWPEAGRAPAAPRCTPGPLRHTASKMRGCARRGRLSEDRTTQGRDFPGPQPDSGLTLRGWQATALCAQAEREASCPRATAAQITGLAGGEASHTSCLSSEIIIQQHLQIHTRLANPLDSSLAVTSPFTGPPGCCLATHPLPDC